MCAPCVNVINSVWLAWAALAMGSPAIPRFVKGCTRARTCDRPDAERGVDERPSGPGAALTTATTPWGRRAQRETGASLELRRSPHRRPRPARTRAFELAGRSSRGRAHAGLARRPVCVPFAEVWSHVSRSRFWETGGWLLSAVCVRQLRANRNLIRFAGTRTAVLRAGQPGIRRARRASHVRASGRQAVHPVAVLGQLLHGALVTLLDDPPGLGLHQLAGRLAQIAGRRRAWWASTCATRRH